MSIVKVVKNNYTVEPLYQWDLNQVLQVYGLSLARVPEVHFKNAAMSRAIVRQARMDAAGVVTVDVPNSLLQKHYPITAYICGYNGRTFETYYKIKVPVKERAQPADYTLQDDPEVYSFNALENAVVNAQRDMVTATETLKTTNDTINQVVAATVAGALPGFLDDTLTDPNKAAPAAVVQAALDTLNTDLQALIEGRAQVVSGSYVGTGTNGEENPNVLEFPFAPRIVALVSLGTDSMGPDFLNFRWMVRPLEASSWNSNFNTSTTGTVSWGDDGKSVSWWVQPTGTNMSSGPSAQLNTSGKTYHYIAIG